MLFDPSMKKKRKKKKVLAELDDGTMPAKPICAPLCVHLFMVYGDVVRWAAKSSDQEKTFGEEAGHPCHIAFGLRVIAPRRYCRFPLRSHLILP